MRDRGEKRFVCWARRCAPGFFWAFFLLAGCSPQKPGLVAHSHPFHPAGKVVLIEHFAFNPGISTAVNRAQVRQFGELIALDIQRFLRDGGFKNPLAVSPGEAAKGDFLIRGSLTRVHGGDARERKLLETSGFGATEVRAVGEIVDLAASRTAAGFAFSKQSSYTWLDNEAAVREDLREVAREIAAILIRAR